MSNPIFRGANDEYLTLCAGRSDFHKPYSLAGSEEKKFVIVWNTGATLQVYVDEVPINLGRHEILFLTDLHVCRFGAGKEVRIMEFNRSFYCVREDTSLINCRGILFFGASKVPIIRLPAEVVREFELFWKLMGAEMNKRLTLQLDMLRLLVKHFLILSTRLYLNAEKRSAPAPLVPLVQDFHYWLETHFRKYHDVKAYADLLHTTPKHLARMIRSYQNTSPLRLIQSRIILEARRILLYTDKPIKEIAYHLGFEDIPSFSRFFKRYTGTAPRSLREKRREHKIP